MLVWGVPEPALEKEDRQDCGKGCAEEEGARMSQNGGKAARLAQLRLWPLLTDGRLWAYAATGAGVKPSSPEWITVTVFW